MTEEVAAVTAVRTRLSLQQTELLIKPSMSAGWGRDVRDTTCMYPPQLAVRLFMLTQNGWL